MHFRWLDEPSGTLQRGPAEVCRRFLALGIVHYTTLPRSMNYLYRKRQELICQMEKTHWQHLMKAQDPCSLSRFCKVGVIITQLQSKHPEQAPLREGHRAERQRTDLPIWPCSPTGFGAEEFTALERGTYLDV